jgi:molecular chaperone DnaK (HSP70)
MRVAIDFGTTHTVVAVVGRGNYPVVSFDGMDTWPSLIAARNDTAVGQLRFGVDAATVRHEPTLTMQPAGFQHTFRLQRRVAAGV